MASTSTSSLDSDAVYPLTVFDTSSERTTFVTGWLVEGRLDEKLLADALSRLTEKWRMLAGRLELRTDEQQKKLGWQIRIPLGPIPESYSTYTLTTAAAPEPLSTLVPLPIPTVSTKLPASIFLHPSTPILNSSWASQSAPLMAWHLTYFLPEHGAEQGHTAIGFARAHGVFDGLSAAAIVNALQAEIHGKDWTVTSLPKPGLNENILTAALEDISVPAENPPVGSTNLTLWGIIKLVAFHTWEKWWHQCEEHIVLLPKSTLAVLLHDVRAELPSDAGASVSSGDVITAWAIKTIYKNDYPSQKTVNWSNLASFRTLIFPPNVPYPHNAFIPVPYPLLTVTALQKMTLSTLCQSFAEARHALTPAHIKASYIHLKNSPFAVHYNCDANEVVLTSNVSASRILEADWSGVGAGRTIAGYRYAQTTTKMPFTNTVYISGRLPDTGAVVLDVFLRRSRMNALVSEVERLVRATTA